MTRRVTAAMIGRRRAWALSILAAWALGCWWAQAPCVAAQPGQIDLPRVEQMPNVPQPFRMIDWKARARALDEIAFDYGAKGEHLPLIRRQDSRVNFPRPSFAIPSYVGTPWAGLSDGQVRGEGIAALGAVLGGTLAGIDKSNQHGRNFVLMTQEFFQRASGARVFLNGVGPAHMGGSFWYDLLPNVYFFCLADRCPKVEGGGELMKAAADQWCRAVGHMTGPDGRADFNWTAFDFRTMDPTYNGRWPGGFAAPAACT